MEMEKGQKLKERISQKRKEVSSLRLLNATYPITHQIFQIYSASQPYHLDANNGP